MAWDFETDAEYQAQLDWADAFVRDEVEPLDLALPGKQYVPPDKRVRQIIDPLKEEVRKQRAVGHPPRPRTRRRGATGSSSCRCSTRSSAALVGAADLRLPGPGHRERRDHRPLRHAGAEGALPAPAARRRGLLVLLDDRAARRLRPDPVQDPGRPGRRRVGHQRVEVLLLQRQHRGVPHRHGGHRPRPQPVPGHVDVPGADGHARASTSSATSAWPASRRARASTRSSTTTTSGCPPTPCSAARARRSRSPRPASAAAGSTTPCARSGWPARRST